MITTLPKPIARCVTAHVGARDHYQLSLALHEVGALERLITEAYAPDRLSSVLSKQTGKRYCSQLSSSAVTVSAKALGLTALARLMGRNYNHRIDQAISRHAYKLAVQTRANLFLHSYYAYWAFRQAIREGYPAPRLLFQIHPHPYSIRQLLEEEIDRVPFAAQSILDEDEFRLSFDRLEALALEPSLASVCVTASQFTKETLIRNGIPAKRIRVIPYGVDTTRFPARITRPNPSVFRIIFVGRMNQRKGLADLLEAVRLLRHQRVEVVLCGRGYVDKNILHTYSDLPIRVLLNLSSEQLLHELHQSHVFVLPALAEGFGHVILEAMAAGLPVITTANTGAPDVMQAGVHGAIVPTRNPQRIREQLEAVISRPNDWFDMGQEAAQQARLFTWSRFRAQIAAMYEEAITKQPAVLV